MPIYCCSIICRHRAAGARFHERLFGIQEGWRVVFASLVGIGLGMSPVPFYTIGMLAPELAKQFHWQFAQIMGGITMMTATVLIAAPVAGLLADRFGVRSVVLISIVRSASHSRRSRRRRFVAAVLCDLGADLDRRGGHAADHLDSRRQQLVRCAQRARAGPVLVGTGLFGFLIKPCARG